MMTKTKLIGGAIAAAALLVPAVAAAQDNPYAPLGIRSGAFLIFPSLRAGAAYDDNVFATESDEEDDFIFTLRPEVSAQSQWSRHSLELSAFGEVGLYQDFDDNNYEDFGAALSGTLDVRRNSRSDGRLGITRLHEDRDDPDDTGGDDVTQFWFYDATIGHRHEFNRLFVRPTAFARRYAYEEAGEFSNAERDYNNYGLGLRSGVIVSPRINVFAEVNGDLVRYDDGEPDNEDSEGYQVLGGVEVDVTRLIVGEASLGYGARDYDGDFDDTDGVAGNLGIVWTPTELTTVDFRGRAGIDESDVIFEGERASGVLNTTIGVTVRHDLRRNIQLNVRASYAHEDFEGTSRTDETYRIGGGIAYLINRNFSIDAGYDFSTRDSDEDASEFDRNIFRIGLTARL
jgi:hypothetical protein